MHRLNNIYEKIICEESLFQGYKRALKSNAKSKTAMEFYFNAEKNIDKLHDDLESGNYLPGELFSFTIYDPKERVISAAPFRDRVLHQAICAELEPFFEKKFIYHTYACRKNKGTHKAVLQAQKYIKGSRWFLKSDIRKYFDSIDHTILLTQLEKIIRDNKLVNLLGKIINANFVMPGKGIPIGNLTSQYFANFYLNRFDHYLKDFRGVGKYIRYMDDFVIFEDDKEVLKRLLADIRVFLLQELKLELKEKATYINSRENGLSFLGWRIFPNLIKINNSNLKRSLKKLGRREKEYSKGAIDEEKLIQSGSSVMGHIRYFNTRNLCLRIFNKGWLSHN